MRWFPILVTLVVCWPLSAQDASERVRELLESATGESNVTTVVGVTTAVGVTRRGTPIPAILRPEHLDASAKGPRLLIVAGLDGSDASVRAALGAWRESLSSPVGVSVLPLVNPDGWNAGPGAEGAPGNGSGGSPSTGYPPEEPSYLSQTDPEKQYVWRWIGLHAPDLVIEVVGGDRRRWLRSEASTLDALAAKLGADAAAPDGSLTAALAQHAAANVGTIPALRLEVSEQDDDIWGALRENLDLIEAMGRSPARAEIATRSARKPIDAARQLTAVYGHQLDNVVYIPALALIGRLRFGSLTHDEEQVAEVEQIVKPYLDGAPTLPQKPTSSHWPGHLVFGELAKATGNPAYVRLALRAADAAFNADGSPREAMPLHNEMSDSVFMGCAILAQAGALTGDKRYFDMALRHMRFMQRLDWRRDGLYRHSPLDEAAWGRGNGFPALGLSWALSEIPEGYEGREEMLEAFRKHMRALLPHQDASGMWHEVIDHPESYRELTATAMIGAAMQRGVGRGWLPADEFDGAIAGAWRGVKARVAADGSLADVCRSTGKQQSLRDYFDREAILGPDDRGGAMALLFAVEIAAADRR